MICSLSFAQIVSIRPINLQLVMWALVFEHMKLPAKSTDYFLRSNKSNINQIIHSVHSSLGVARGPEEANLLHTLGFV